MTLADAFEQARRREELALIAYLTAGFPTLGEFAGHLHAVADAGADIIEVGLPFSDPLADGPTIQHSSHVALQSGARLDAVLDCVRAHPVSPPLVLMSYLNPLLSRPRDALLASLREAGFVGLIVPDLPVEESAEWSDSSQRAGMDLIQMAAPTSGEGRLSRIAAASRGFLYALSRTGTTGAREGLPPQLPAFLRRLRSLTRTPIAVGFGISTPEHVRSLRGVADGVVVGSRIVEAIRIGEDVRFVVAGLKAGTRA